jgi:hypothetical protein
MKCCCKTKYGNVRCSRKIGTEVREIPTKKLRKCEFFLRHNASNFEILLQNVLPR